MILMDYMLGNGTAFDLFEHVNPDTPIVIITGTGDEDIAVKAMKAGALDYLIKDPLRNYLKGMPITVNNAINAKKMERELKRYYGQLEQKVKKRTSQLEETNKQLETEIQKHKHTEDALYKEIKFQGKLDQCCTNNNFSAGYGRSHHNLQSLFGKTVWV